MPVTFTAPASGAERHVLGERVEHGDGRHRRLRPGERTRVHRQRQRRQLHGHRELRLRDASPSRSRTPQAASPRRSRRRTGEPVGDHGEPLPAAAPGDGPRRQRQPGRRRDGHLHARRRRRRRGAAAASTAAASFDGGGDQATELTDASGTATSPLFTANSTAGTFTATAATAGVVEPASFSLDNLAGKPPTITTLAAVEAVGDRRCPLRKTAAGERARRQRRPAAGGDGDVHARLRHERRRRGGGRLGRCGRELRRRLAARRPRRPTPPASRPRRPSAPTRRRGGSRRSRARAAPPRWPASRSTTWPGGRRRSRRCAASKQSATVGTRYGKPLAGEGASTAGGAPLQGATVTFTLGSATSGGAGAGGSAAPAQASSTAPARRPRRPTPPASRPRRASAPTRPRGGSRRPRPRAAPPRWPASRSTTWPGSRRRSRRCAASKQSATVGARYGKPLQVKVRDGRGAPLQGATVTFTLGSATTAAAARGRAARLRGRELRRRLQPGDRDDRRRRHRDLAALQRQHDGGRGSPRPRRTSGTTEVASFPLDNLAGKSPTITALAEAEADSATVGDALRQAAAGEGARRWRQAAARRDRHLHPRRERRGQRRHRLGERSRGELRRRQSAKRPRPPTPPASPPRPRLTANTTAGTFTATATTTGTVNAASFALHNLPGRPAIDHRGRRGDRVDRTSGRASRSGSRSPSPTRTATPSRASPSASPPPRLGPAGHFDGNETHRQGEDRCQGRRGRPAVRRERHPGRLRRARDSGRPLGCVRARQRAGRLAR